MNEDRFERIEAKLDGVLAHIAESLERTKTHEAWLESHIKRDYSSPIEQISRLTDALYGDDGLDPEGKAGTRKLGSGIPYNEQPGDAAIRIIRELRAQAQKDYPDECTDCHYKTGDYCTKAGQEPHRLREANAILSEGCRYQTTEDEFRAERQRQANSGGCGECTYWSAPGSKTVGICTKAKSHRFKLTCAYDYTCGYHRTRG